MLEPQVSYIKLAVDVARGILAGGGEYHADCEEILLENGSRQEDIWGADWYPENRTVTFGALINIRPREGNRSMEIEDAARERFLRDAPDRQLGNLASDLLRLSTWLRMRRDDQATLDLIREIAWMIEWAGAHATEELVNVQRELCRWRRIWPLESARSLLAFRARGMSDCVLQMSRLSAESERVGSEASRPKMQRPL